MMVGAVTGGRRPSTARGEEEVFVGSIWMLAGTLAASLGGFAFWLIAARMSGADVIGRSAGLFSSIFFLSYATSLGLPVAVATFAASPKPLETQRFQGALLATVLSSLAGAATLIMIDPGDLLGPVTARGPVATWLVIPGLAAGVAVSVLVDVRLMGHRMWHKVFARSAAIALIRIPPLLLAVQDESGFWIFVIAAGGYAVTAIPYLPVLLAGKAPGPWALRDHVEMIRFAGVNYLSQLAIQAPVFVTPLVIALVVADEENATFYLAWGMMSVVYVGIHVLGKTLLVESGRPGVQVARQARTTLAIGLGVAVPVTLLSVPLSPIAGQLYGPEHDQISTMLPLLMFGNIPWVITRTSLAIARAQNNTRQTLLVATWSAVAVLGGVGAGALLGGATTASMGWALGSAAAVLVSGPVLRDQLRPSRA